MGAISVLSLESNNLTAAGGKALADGLKGNNVITELNIAGNYLGKNARTGRDDMSGFIVLADVIPDMGALAKIDISRNKIPSKQQGEIQRICTAHGKDLGV